jgi:hypothetical protein
MMAVPRLRKDTVSTDCRDASSRRIEHERLVESDRPVAGWEQLQISSPIRRHSINARSFVDTLLPPGK